MVVFTIITIISGIVLTSQSTFNNTLSLSNAAYDIALTLRSAQTYGISSRATLDAAVNAGYGLHFENALPGSLTLFADTYPAPSIASVCHPTNDASSPNAKPGNCAYDPDQGEHVMSYALGNGMLINDFCAFTDGWSCVSSSGLSSLDIVFLRPNPNPFIGVNGLYSAASAVCLSITSPQGAEKYVSVSASGQINANAPSCP